MKINYYLGGYYLIKLRSIQSANNKNDIVYTCSDCINDNLVFYSLLSDFLGNEYVEQIKSEYGFNKNEIELIRQWISDKYVQNQIGFSNVFTEIQFAKEYKNKFFKNLNQVKLLSIYFNENESNEIFKFFNQCGGRNGNGICQILDKKISEKDNEEKLLGYDLIGMEWGGDFHSFHCHNIEKELSKKFEITLNEYGLFNDCQNLNLVLDYMNNEENGFEHCPWFVGKVKMVSENILEE